MKRFRFTITPFVLILPLLCSADEVPIKTGMTELHATLLNLNHDLTRPLPQPGSPEHQKVEVRMERLGRLAHRVSAQKPTHGTGQLYSILGEALPEQANQMTVAWRLGQTSYSRALFRTLSTTCLECHSASGSKSPIAHPIEDKEMALWNPIDRGRYLRSVGHIEQAFEEFRQVIRHPVPSADSQFILEEALYELLSLETRTAGHPTRLLGVLKPLLGLETLPKYLGADLSGWIRDLEAWSRESTPKKIRITGTSLLKRARKHIVKARKLQESATDRSSLVWYWRAVTDLYGSMKQELSPEQRGDALFLLGSAFEVLTPRNQETLHERFYESCIREVPHTPRSDLCYRKLERTVISGYTGSSGTRIPEEVRKRLLELWGSAFLKKGLELR